MAEGARKKFEMSPEEARELMRRQEPEDRRGEMDKPEIDPAFLGDMSARLFDLQAERARLEGLDASDDKLAEIDRDIASTQAFIDEHAEDYARMEMPREITQTIRVPEKLREKPSDLKTQLKDLQKRYDLTAEQLEAETDPEARAALENGINSLRERIHGLKADLPWEKEDRLLAKGTLKRSSAAREKARTAAPENFEAAELDRAALTDLREGYARSLENPGLPKVGETLIRGAVQTMEDALARYGRGDLSVEDFQMRVKEIERARKMWGRYVQDTVVSEARGQRKEQERIEKEQESARVAEEASRAEKARKAEQNEEIRRRLKKVAEKQDAEKALRATQKQSAEAQAEVEKTVAMEVALSEAAKQRAEIRARIAEKMGRLKEKARVNRGADLSEAMADIRNLPPPPTAEETAEARRQASEVVEAMEAGPDINVPDNLPVAPEVSAEDQMRARVEKMRDTGTLVVARRSDGRIQPATILTMSGDRVTVSVDDPDARKGQSLTKSPTIAEFLRWQDETPLEERVRIHAKAKADTLVEASTARVNQRIDELQGKIRAEQDRLRRERNELRPGQEEAWFAQGEKPEVLAHRERAQELYPNMDVDQAELELSKIEAKSARDFANEADFTDAFVRAVEKYPSDRTTPEAASRALAEEYWELLTKDNERLAEAMKPQPKVGFWKRLFGGAPKPKETMTAEELVRFQELDKYVRDVMETPATGARADLFRAGMGKSGLSGPMGIGRSRPR